jgi:hypothetical protein
LLKYPLRASLRGYFLSFAQIDYNGGMEINYDIDNTPECPKVNCHKKQCECGLTFISVPAVLTKEMAPKNGCYANAIVKYEETGEVYIYSKEGVPVKVKDGSNS